MLGGYPELSVYPTKAWQRVEVGHRIYCPDNKLHVARHRNFDLAAIIIISKL